MREANMKTFIKNNMKAVWLVCTCMVTFPACTDMMETDSTTGTFEDGNRLDSPNDSLYSVLGVLSQVQRLGDRYVLLGELRGDLMEATEDANVDIQEISDFSVSPDNEYASFYDYYNVINNCNYAIAKMDTNIVFYEDKVMIPEYAQIKVIRAWTYWQLGLATGQVSWIEEPVLNLESALKDYPQKNLEDLAQSLIDDLTPYVGVRSLDYGAIDNFDSRKMFFPVDMVLGDLYLFLGRYADAATAYYRLIDNRNLTLTGNYGNYWGNTSRTSLSSGWMSAYMDTNSSELLASLVYGSKPDAYHPQLVRWSYNEVPSIVPSASFVDWMSRVSHYYAAENTIRIQGFFVGDLRGQFDVPSGTPLPSSFSTNGVGDYNGTLINKFYSLSVAGGVEDPENEALGGLRYVRNLPVYRTSQVYLRLAEAINRYGRPATAFAILVYGLNKTTLVNASRIPAGERTGEVFLDFTSDTYDNNVGTATRGRGRAIGYTDSDYLIPDYTPRDKITETDEETGEEVEREVISTDPARLAAAKADSIEYVENCIIDEMAAETAFEGSRFFDLMRIARHRGQWPAYAAEKVAARFKDGGNGIRERLMDEGAWFLK